MAETEYIVYIDPNEAQTSPETILNYQLLLGTAGGNVSDYRVIGVEKCEDVFAHEMMSADKLRDSIENAFLAQVEHLKEEAKIAKPDRMN